MKTTDYFDASEENISLALSFFSDDLKELFDKKFTYNSLTPLESVNFKELALDLEEYLKFIYDLKLYKYSDDEIKDILKNYSKFNGKMLKYKTKNELLEYYKISNEELLSVLNKLSYLERLIYDYRFGINGDINQISDISRILKINYDLVNYIIYNTDLKIKNYMNNKKRKKTHNFYDYFSKEDRPLAIKILKNLKKVNEEEYNLIEKTYGENFVNKVVVDNEILPAIKVIVKKIHKVIPKVKENIYLDDETNEKFKNNFYDYFKVQDRKIVAKCLSKIKNESYYQTLIKVYDEETWNLKKYETSFIENKIMHLIIKQIKNTINSIYINDALLPKKKVVRPKNKKIKNINNFYEYFDDCDKPLVKEILGEYKAKNHRYYQVVVKKYGLNYDTSNDVTLNKQEQRMIYNLIFNIKKYIKEDRLPYIKKTTNVQKKMNFYEYFDDCDKHLVKEILEKYKLKNNKYYQVVVKKYGLNYDTLTNIVLDENEYKTFYEGVTAIRKRINNEKNKIEKKSFYEYFDNYDKLLVKDALEEYKLKNHRYYQVVVKKYGLNYDTLNKVTLTKQEKRMIYNFVYRVKRSINEKKVKIEKYKKLSFYEYFDDFDKPLVKEVLDEYKLKNHKYYQVVVKKYGLNYDNLANVVFDENEKKLFHNLIVVIRKYIQRQKEIYLLNKLKSYILNPNEIELNELKEEIEKLSKKEQINIYNELKNYLNGDIKNENKRLEKRLNNEN